MVFAFAGDSTITRFFDMILAPFKEIKYQEFFKKSNFRLIKQAKRLVLKTMEMKIQVKISDSITFFACKHPIFAKICLNLTFKW